MISVCMAIYNGARFIKQQIDSILPQLGADDELIISDDGSTDGTLEIIAGYNDERIKILKHSPNKNFSNHEKATANFENALSVAKGDYIFLSDQDDEWLENKVSECVKYLESVDFIVHKKNCFDSDSRKIVKTDDDIQLPDTWLHNIFHMKLFGCCMAFNRKLLNIAIPFPHRLIGHDYWISSLAIRFLSCDVINEPLINYRLHSDAVSQGKHKSIIYKISYRLQLYKQILQRIKKQKQRKII